MDRRRTLTAVLAAGPLLWAFRSLVPGAGAPWAWPGAVLLTVLAAVSLAGYVAPAGSGRLVERGCTPCAVVPAATVVMAMLLLDSSPDVGGLVTAAGALVVGMLQRRASATTCALPPAAPPAR